MAIGLATLAIVVAALTVAAYVSPLRPGWVRPTLGRIYVESPEVYTRERLVNDRYRQDYWLKTQLERLDARVALVQEQESFGLATTFGGGERRGPSLGEVPPIAFQEEFYLRSTMRDKIRQLVLENLLDDRHDLTGNSVYGLKFDTAVIPGLATFARPYVVVRLKLDPLRRADDSKIPPEEFLAVTGPAPGVAPESTFGTVARQFRRWEQNLEERTGRQLEAAIEGGTECERAENVVAAKAEPDAPQVSVDFQPASPVTPCLSRRLEDLLNNGPKLAGIVAETLRVNPRDVRILGQESTKRVQLPEPWGRYFQLWVSAGQGRTSKLLDVDFRPFTANVLVADRDAWNAFQRTVQQDGVSTEGNIRYGVNYRFRAGRPLELAEPVAIGGEESSRLSMFIKEYNTGSEGTFEADFADERFLNELTRVEIEQLVKRSPVQTCLYPPTPSADGECLLPGLDFLVPYSLYNFVKTALDFDAYSYAVFPRGDVAGVASLASLAAAVATPTEAPVAAGLETWSDSAGVRAEQRLVNFAGSGGQSNKDFDFGWAFVDEGRQEPGQVSQLVLVSVPAYLDALELQVETGWLDRNANPIGGLPRPGEDPERFSRKLNTIKVVLPPDYEALDTLVVGGVNPRGPWINDAKIEPDLYVAACAPAAILIPGDRLWRSTSVTLGAQIADKITVLPDMRGIVASFDEVDPPPRPDGATEAVLPLTVWTSEGSDSPDRPVTVGIGDAAACGD